MTRVGDHASEQSEGFPLLQSTHTEPTKKNRKTAGLFGGSCVKTIRNVMQPSTCEYSYTSENKGITNYSVMGWLWAFGQPQNMLIFIYCTKKSTLWEVKVHWLMELQQRCSCNMGTWWGMFGGFSEWDEYHTSHDKMVCHVVIQVGLIPGYDSKLGKKETDCRTAGDSGFVKECTNAYKFCPFNNY